MLRWAGLRMPRLFLRRLSEVGCCSPVCCYSPLPWQWPFFIGSRVFLIPQYMKGNRWCIYKTAELQQNIFSKSSLSHFYKMMMRLRGFSSRLTDIWYKFMFIKLSQGAGKRREEDNEHCWCRELLQSYNLKCSHSWTSSNNMCVLPAVFHISHLPDKAETNCKIKLNLIDICWESRKSLTGVWLEKLLRLL